jgi:hypothetical protein
VWVLVVILLAKDKLMDWQPNELHNAWDFKESSAAEHLAMRAKLAATEAARTNLQLAFDVSCCCCCVYSL